MTKARVENEVKITVVGSGDAFCSGARANQALWVDTPECRLLIDCGPTTPYRLQQMGRSPDELDIVLFTHFHGDHFSGVVGLDLDLTLIRKRTRPICYCGGKTIRRRFESLYRNCYPSFYPNDQFMRQFKVIAPYRSVAISESITVTAVPMLHTPESLGYRVQVGDKSFAITGDTAWCEAIGELAQGVEVLICECEYYTRCAGNNNHLTYEDIQEHRPCLGNARLIFTHVGDEVWRHRHSLGIAVADDNMTILL